MEAFQTWRIVAAAVLFGSSPADSQTDCSTLIVSVSKPYVECSVARAMLLEKSKESPENIAIAATGFCSSIARDATSSLGSCAHADTLDIFRAKLDRVAREVVIARIVEKRAAIPSL